MRIVESVETVVVVQELKGIVCNCCGKTSEPHYIDSTQQFRLGFGYGSKYDCETWEFDLCEECLEKFVRGFKVTPQISEMF